MGIARILLHRSQPHFGQLVVWVLLGFSLILASLPTRYVAGERIGPATVIAFLPDSILQSNLFYQATRLVLVVSAILWGTQRVLPWSCWMTVVSFTTLWALRMENTYHAAHIFNVTNMLLIIHAAWYHFYDLELNESLRENKFWSTPLYPRWAFLLSVFYIGLFHSLAGISKLRYSGLQWGDGISLQLWTNLFGWHASPVSQLLINNAQVAMIFQTTALIVETLAILALLPVARTAMGLALLGLYSGILTTFIDFGFHFNAVLIVLFLLPIEPAIRHRMTRAQRSRESL